MLSKEELLLQECVYPYHKMFKNIEVKNHLVKYEKTLANLAQKLAEEAMSEGELTPAAIADTLAKAQRIVDEISDKKREVWSSK